MSFQVDKALVNAYHANVELQFQQKGSKLRNLVRNETQNAEFDFWDRIGPTEAVEVENRHGDTPLISTPHDRRRVALRDYDWADLIDRKDKLRMLQDPTSAYVMNAVYALGRMMDRAIIKAATGTSHAGKEGENSIAFPTANQQIAANFVEDGSPAASNLTIGKLRRARTILRADDAWEKEEGEMAYIVCSSYQIESLLRSTEITSQDYNTVKALVAGEVDTFMGFKFVEMNQSLVPKSGNNRSAICFTTRGILLSVAEDIVTDVGPRRDKRNSVQVYACASFGATRMWEEKVVEILCDETK